MDKKLQDELIGALIGLARATEGTSPTKEIYQTIIQGLTKYNAIDISDDEVRDLIQDVRSKKELLVPDCSKCQAPCGRMIFEYGKNVSKITVVGNETPGIQKGFLGVFELREFLQGGGFPMWNFRIAGRLTIIIEFFLCIKTCGFMI